MVAGDPLMPAPRIYCIPATRAPVVAVFRRGPSAWSHVGRWDLARGEYEPGAWLRARLFPRRSDLSPDGRLLCYFAHKPTATWELGEAYVAISRLPWLSALYAFRTCGTWTRGYHFTRERGFDGPEAERPPIRYGLRASAAVQFGCERRRGWEEAPDSPPRRRTDGWDQYRNARMRKRQPRGERVLCVESLGWAGGEFGVDQAVDGMRVRYSLETGGDLALLEDVQWADWDDAGQLLVATRDGRLQVRDADAAGAVRFERDLSRLEPDTAPSPPWARHWYPAAGLKSRPALPIQRRTPLRRPPCRHRGHRRAAPCHPAPRTVMRCASAAASTCWRRSTCTGPRPSSTCWIGRRPSPSSTGW